KILIFAAEGLTKRSAVGFLLRSLIMFQTFISRHNSNFFSDKLVLTSVTPASSAPVLQTPKATSSTLYFDSLTVNAGNGGFLHCIQMDTSVNAANQVVSVGADIAFDADPKFFACLVRFESSSVPTTLPTAYDVYPLDGRHDGGYYTVKDCVTIDVLPRPPGNNVDVGLVLLLAVLLLLLLVAPCLNCLEAVKKPPPVAFKVMCLLPITILQAWVMLVLNLPFKALMFLTLMRPSLVLFLVLWLKLVKDFLKVRCRLALLPFLISCLIWLDLVASLPLIKERILVIILLLHFLSLMLGSVLVLMLPLLVWLTPDLRIKKSLLKCNWTIRKRLPRCKMRLKKRLLAFS